MLRLRSRTKRVCCRVDALPRNVLVGALTTLLAACVSEPPPTAIRMPRILAAPGAPVTPPPLAPPPVSEALARVERGEFAAAIRVLEPLAFSPRLQALEELFGILVQRDPHEAAELWLALPETWRNRSVTERVAYALTDVDSSGAVRWALGIPRASARVDALRSVADRLLQREGSQALPQLAALPITERRDELLSLAAARWAKREPIEALGWVRQLPDAEERRRLLVSVGFEIAQTAPERAIAIAEELPAGRDRWLLIGQIGRTYVARDAAAAWTWARQLPAGEAREAALAGIESGLGVRGSLAQASPGPAVAPIQGGVRVGSANTLARVEMTGREREEALRREFEERLLFSPVRAADWLSSLPAPDRNDEMVDRLAREWLAVNPAAAETWLEQNVPSEARRRHLLDQAARR